LENHPVDPGAPRKPSETCKLKGVCHVNSLSNM
jgi:hypothetical protein